jgi:hypothetical protein
MAVTAWKAAGTCSSDSAVGSIQWFADVFNNTSLAGTEVSSDNNVNAESQPTSASTSHYLKCTNFGFTSSDVPTGATIDGIEWRFSRYRNAVPTVATTNCKLVKAGSFVGSTVTVTADWPTSETSATMGGATELGGQSWTQSDITASNFGVGISYTCNTTRFFPSSASHFIDIVEVRVHYTAGAGGVGTAFGQLKFQSNVVAFSKRTAGTAFAQLKFTSKVVTNKISNVTQQYGLGDNLNIASMTTDAPLLRDNSAGDNTTYYANGPSAATNAISAYFDLGSAKQVGRLRFRYGFQDVGSWTFYASNDGTSWTDAWTGLPPTSGFSFCSFNWEAEHNATSITSTSYRYWRLVVKDTLSDCSVTEVRLGDYRLYDTSDVEYVPGSGGGGPTYKYGTAVATTAITASVRVAKIEIRRAFSQVVVTSTTRAVRVRMRGTLSQVRVQATARVIKIETRQARASLVVSAQARVSKVEIRQARASLVVVAQALVSKVETRSAFANLVVTGQAISVRVKSNFTAQGLVAVFATVVPSVLLVKQSSLFADVRLSGSVANTVRIKSSQLTGTLAIISAVIASKPKYGVGFANVIVVSSAVATRLKATQITAAVTVTAATQAVRLKLRTVSNSSLVLRSDVVVSSIAYAIGRASLIVAGNASTVRLKTRQALATIIIVATATSAKIEVRSLLGQLRVAASAIPIRLKNQTVNATLVVTATNQAVRIKAWMIARGSAVVSSTVRGIRIKSRSTVGTLVVNAKVTGTKGGRQRIYFIT